MTLLHKFGVLALCCLIGTLVACGTTVTKTNTITISHPVVPSVGTGSADASADYTGYCGQELASIKQLKDSAASQINFTPQNGTIAQLVGLNGGKPQDTPIRIPDEEKVYTIHVNLDKMKAEADSDIHVGVSDGQGHTMIVEFIAPQCEGSLEANQITQARANLFAECGTPSSVAFSSLAGQTATITGVVFFDKLHGQFDVAPNGVELHPVIAFNGCSGAPAPPVTTPVNTTPTTTSVTTTPNPNNSGRGCKKYPNRHWYHHVYHVNCKPYYYVTE